MTRTHKIEVWIASLVVLLLAVGGTLALIRWQKQKLISLHGAVIVQNSDPRKQSPIAGVVISTDDSATSKFWSNSSGFFVLRLRERVRKGRPIILHFRHPQYRPLDLEETISDKLYIINLVPLSNTPVPDNQPRSKVANVRVRYTVKTMVELNVGSAVRTFEIENKGNVPCNGQHPCSPDGKWKAALGSASLDAGVGNEFRNARASCIAGPCPFTRIETDRFSEGGQIITVSASAWSDTTTFLLEAEVFHHMASQNENWLYPVIFGDGLSFTLPPDAESVSIEADIDGQTIIFPLGPSLRLSWANCDAGVNPDKARIYHCTSKPGYRFQ